MKRLKMEIDTDVNATEGQGRDRERKVRVTASSKSTSENKPADDTELKLYDLNTDCITKIMSYLYIDDIMNMELVHSKFGRATTYFYSRYDWVVDIPILNLYPTWLWRKIGKHGTFLRILNVESKKILRQIFDIFPNLEYLSCHSVKIFKLDNVPMQLKSLRLHDCSLTAQSSFVFKQFSSTVTEFEIYSPNDSSKNSWLNLNNIKTAVLDHTFLPQKKLTTFLSNNRDSLEKLSLVDPLDDREGYLIYDTLDTLSKLTTFAIYKDISISMLSESFCAKIKCFTLLHAWYLDVEGFIPFTQLECLTVVYRLSLTSLLWLIENIPTLRTVQTFIDFKVDELIEASKPILAARKTEFTLVLTDSEVSQNFS